MNFKYFFESKQGFMAPETAAKIERAIANIGGKVWVVGGAVRDFLNPDSPPSKDIDLLVTDLPIRDPESALKRIVGALRPISQSKVDVVGESFGVIKAIVDGEDLDIAIPRESETKTGSGHSDFDVKLDPTASVESDLARRDFTINAIASSLDGKDIVDPFGGRKDLKNRNIRAVGDADSRFGEDPLRILRGMQAAARFGFSIKPNTYKAMVKNKELLQHIAGERILEELKKALTKGKADSYELVGFLEQSGIGKLLFGNDFNPIPVEDKDHSFDTRFIGLFFNGGDLNRLNPTNDLRDFVLLAREFSGTKLPYEFIGKHKDKLPKVHSFFYNAGMDKEKYKVDKAMHTAVVPKDLVISGQDLLDAGLKGKEIGFLQKEMLKNIWLGKLENSFESLSKFIKKHITNK